MALWLQPGEEPETAEERADLDAIIALRESAAIELKEKGNEYVKMGKMHYKEAVDCYTRAIDQKSSDPLHNSICYSNRAHVELLLGNNRRAYSDAQEAIKANPANIKAYFRGAKAALALGLHSEASNFCVKGLELDPKNDELKKIGDKMQKLLAEEDARSKRALEKQHRAEALASVLESRKSKVGRATYKQLTGARKPWLDKSQMLHWPVLLLYGEVMASDFIEDFCETDMFSTHLDLMFGGDSPPLSWDTRNEYTRNRVELYYQLISLFNGSHLTAACVATEASPNDFINLLYAYQANAAPAISNKQLVQWLQEDDVSTKTAGTDDDMDDRPDFKKQQWVKVDEKATLFSVLSRRDHVVPGIPVFYAVASGSSFYDSFLSGEWSPPAG